MYCPTSVPSCSRTVALPAQRLEAFSIILYQQNDADASCFICNMLTVKAYTTISTNRCLEPVHGGSLVAAVSPTESKPLRREMCLWQQDAEETSAKKIVPCWSNAILVPRRHA